jgi:hypothetical protein
MTAVVIIATLAMLALLALKRAAATSRAKAETRAAQALFLTRLHADVERLILWQ